LRVQTDICFTAEAEEPVEAKEDEETNDNGMLKPSPLHITTSYEINSGTSIDTRTDMELDSKKPVKANIGKKRVDKRKQRKAGIVFQRYSDRIKKRKAASSKASKTVADE
jgi:hypothetical protein